MVIPMAYKSHGKGAAMHRLWLGGAALVAGCFPAAIAQGEELATSATARMHVLNDQELRGVAPPAVMTMMRAPAPAARPSWLNWVAPGSAVEAKQNGLGLSSWPLLSAEVVLKDVTYGPNGALPRLNPDGSVSLPVPVSIGELSIQNIRAAPGDLSSAGTIQFKGIDLSGTSVTVYIGK
jgi:hypothetical protein